MLPRLPRPTSRRKDNSRTRWPARFARSCAGSIPSRVRRGPALFRSHRSTPSAAALALGRIRRRARVRSRRKPPPLRRCVLNISFGFNHEITFREHFRELVRADESDARLAKLKGPPRVGRLQCVVLKDYLPCGLRMIWRFKTCRAPNIAHTPDSSSHVPQASGVAAGKVMGPEKIGEPPGKSPKPPVSP